MTGRCEVVHDGAAYLLGALDPADERAYAAHLAGCPECAAELDELRPTVALLALLPVGPDAEPDIDAGPVPDTLLPGLLRRAARERSRRRGLVLGLAGVAAACVVALVVAVWPASTPERTPGQALQPVRSAPIAATAHFVSKPWGTQIDLECRYQRELQADVAYRLVVVDVDRHRYDAGGWKVGEGVTNFVSGTEVQRDRISQVEITLPNGRAVLRLTL